MGNRHLITLLSALCVFAHRCQCYGPLSQNPVTPSSLPSDGGQLTFYSSSPDYGLVGDGVSSSSSEATPVSRTYWWENVKSPFVDESSVVLHVPSDSHGKLSSNNDITGAIFQSNPFLNEFLNEKKLTSLSTPRPDFSSTFQSASYGKPDIVQITSNSISPSAPASPFTGIVNSTPYPGCAAALKCVPDEYCSVEGYITNVAVALTKDLILLRVPLSECQDLSTGLIGKCCRDPNYTDPWPSDLPHEHHHEQEYHENNAISTEIGLQGYPFKTNSIYSTPATPVFLSTVPSSTEKVIPISAYKPSTEAPKPIGDYGGGDSNAISPYPIDTIPSYAQSPKPTFVHAQPTPSSQSSYLTQSSYASQSFYPFQTTYPTKPTYTSLSTYPTFQTFPSKQPYRPSYPVQPTYSTYSPQSYPSQPQYVSQSGYFTPSRPSNIPTRPVYGQQPTSGPQGPVYTYYPTYGPVISQQTYYPGSQQPGQNRPPTGYPGPGSQQPGYPSGQPQPQQPYPSSSPPPPQQYPSSTLSPQQSGYPNRPSQPQQPQQSYPSPPPQQHYPSSTYPPQQTGYPSGPPQPQQPYPSPPSQQQYPSATSPPQQSGYPSGAPQPQQPYPSPPPQQQYPSATSPPQQSGYPSGAPQPQQPYPSPPPQQQYPSSTPPPQQSGYPSGHPQPQQPYPSPPPQQQYPSSTPQPQQSGYPSGHPQPQQPYPTPPPPQQQYPSATSPPQHQGYPSGSQQPQQPYPSPTQPPQQQPGYPSGQYPQQPYPSPNPSPQQPGYPNGPSQQPGYPNGPSQQPGYPNGPPQQPGYPNGPPQQPQQPYPSQQQPGYPNRPQHPQQHYPSSPSHPGYPSHAPQQNYPPHQQSGYYVIVSETSYQPYSLPQLPADNSIASNKLDGYPQVTPTEGDVPNSQQSDISTGVAVTPITVPKEYSATCGVKSNDGTAFGEAPWHAIVYSSKNKDLICAGAIVSENAVLTAAHCLDHSEADSTEVKIGPNGKVFKVAAISRHEKYEAVSYNRDLALVILREPIQFDKYIEKICLPTSFAQKESLDRECYVSTLTKEFRPETLKTIPVQVFPYKDCEAKLKSTYLGKYFVLNDSFSCVSTPADDELCNVKTGSPIACNKGDGTYELFGIKSWDLGCQEYRKTAIFSNFDIFWVQQMLSTPVTQLIANEQSYLKAKFKGESLLGVDTKEKPGFGQGYGK